MRDYLVVSHSLDPFSKFMGRCVYATVCLGCEECFLSIVTFGEFAVRSSVINLLFRLRCHSSGRFVRIHAGGFLAVLQNVSVCHVRDLALIFF